MFGSTEETTSELDACEKKGPHWVAQIEKWLILPDDDRPLKRRAKKTPVNPWHNARDAGFAFDTCVWARLQGSATFNGPTHKFIENLNSVSGPFYHYKIVMLTSLLGLCSMHHV